MKKLVLLAMSIVMAVSNVNAQTTTYSFSHTSEPFFSIDTLASFNQQIGPYHFTEYFYPFFPAFPVTTMKGFGHPRSDMNAYFNNYGGMGFETLYDGQLGDFTAFAAGLEFTTLGDGWAGFAALRNPANSDSVVICEYHNVVFEDIESEYSCKFTFQIWIHSLNGVVEFKYGPRHIEPDAALTKRINAGLGFNYPGGLNTPSYISHLHLIGNPNSPVMVEDDGTGGLQGWPAENKVYRFTPAPIPVNPTGIKENVTNSSVKLYPNPANKTLMFSLSGSKIIKAELYNVSGQKVKTEQPNGKNEGSMQIADLASGMYILKLVTANGAYTKSVLVAHP